MLSRLGAAQANSLAGRLDGVEETQRQMALIDLMVTEAGVVR
ncbi:hypothetical protein [Microvenator marinus]|nr:hypothetical protein [Microvenator marinus]